MWETGRYMVHVFQEKGDWYVYDLNSNEVYGVHEVVAHALKSTAKDREDLVAELSDKFKSNDIETALKEIDETREKHGVFKEWELGWEGKCPICSNPENYIDKMQQLVFETTSDCNLRCVYCSFTYQEGEHARKANTPENLVKAANFFLDHSGKGGHRAISFYGGEPLLELDNIRVVLDVIKERGLLDEVRIVLDTNATLINDEIIDLISQNKMTLQISLDGPERIHDANRVFTSGKGSHAAVIRNVKKLAERLPNFRETALFMCTMAPPYEIEEIDDYFKNLYEDLGIGGVPNMMANFATINHVLDHYTENYGDCKALQLEAFSKAVEHYVSCCTSGRRDELGPVYRSLFDRNLANLYRRSNFPIPENMGLNACCAPGVRKLYVTATGEYLPCERMSYDYVIGHADRGIEHDLVDNLYKDLGAAVKDRCLNCWAIRICSLCFTHMLEKKDGSGLYVPIQFCEYMRESKEEELKLFLGMHQANPESLEFLKEFTFE